jgi:hypothetical protein
MYLSPTPRGQLGVDLLPSEMRFNALYRMVGGRSIPFQNGGTPPTDVGPPGSRWTMGPARPQPPIRTVNEQPLPAVYTVPTPPQAVTPAPAPIAATNPNAGTPVPAGFPTNQIFVNSDGSFWEYGPNGWASVGTPYNTGAAATPAAPAPSPSGASSAPAAGVAPPINVSIAPATSSYQAILDWLQQDSLLSSVGFTGIPNWIAGGAIVLIGYKVTQKSGRH